MRIGIVAVGRLKERYWREAAEEYLKRLTPYATVRVTEIADRDLSRDEAAAIALEGTDTLRAIPEGALLVALDRGGKQFTSEEFAAWIAEHALAGRSSIAFVLGGAAGLAPEVLTRADERVSFGALTLPHQLARVVLLEQLYRAFRIMRGEPYHR